MAVIGVGRRDYTDADFRTQMQEAIGIPKGGFWETFQERLFYQKADFENDGDYAKLAATVGLGSDVIYYLATAPKYFPLIIEKLHSRGLLQKNAKVVLEKPFGYDLGSARGLRKTIRKYLWKNRFIE